MLDQETKRRIDNARDILVGKLPNPQGQVEQITIALIYKFMDDMDKEAMEFGGEPSYFIGEFEKYSWSNIFDPRLGGFELLALYGEAIEMHKINPNLPQLFRDIFKNTFLPYRDPETLKMFLKVINEFHYDHSEKLGDAFEYLLSVLGSQGDAGQFRTPRHIIDFMVEIIQPKKGESVLDPACGTAGFLISAYKHIIKENTKKNQGDLLTPEDRKKLINNFTGYDISFEMVRLSLVNLYLHGFTTPKIFEYDTLSNESRWGDTFDIILANPPFMTPKGGIRPHKKFTLQANRSEVLFVDYIMEHINPTTGRAAVIVPEGIIFQSATAYKALRKMLVDKNYLYGVVSLPAGLFQPYSGVKTSILLMDKSLAKKSDKILFVKIDNDGFDLGAQRRAIASNDLTGCLGLLQSYKRALQDGTAFESDNKNVFLVEKGKIGAKDEYNLSIDRYRVNENVQTSDFEMVLLQDICEIKKGSSITKKGTSEGTYPVIAGGQQPAYFHNEFNRTGEVITVSSSGAYAGFLNYFTTPIFASDCTTIQTKEGDDAIVLCSFLFYLLKSKQDFFYSLQKGGAQPHVYGKDFGLLEIPLPPLSIQQQIVSKIEGYQKIIDGAKQVVENYKAEIDIDEGWEMVKLGEVLQKINANINPQDFNGEVKYIGLENIESNSGSLVGEVNSVYSIIKSAKTKFIKGDVLYGKLRPNLNKVYMATFDGICSTDIIVLRERNGISIGKFYAEYLRGEKFNKEVLTGIKGAQLPRVGFEYLSEIIIPLPPISIQQAIVKRIEEEQELVNGNKELIRIFEGKIKEEIGKLWQSEPVIHG